MGVLIRDTDIGCFYSGHFDQVFLFGTPETGCFYSGQLDQVFLFGTPQNWVFLFGTNRSGVGTVFIPDTDKIDRLLII